MKIRILTLAFGVGAMAVSSSAGLYAQPRSLLSRLQVGAWVHYADGTRAGTFRPFNNAVLSQPVAAEFYMTNTICVFATNLDKYPERAAYGWTLTATPIREQANELVVRVDWKRVRESGRAVDSPGGSAELTLSPGRSVPLDFIVGSQASAEHCTRKPVGVMLQATLLR